MAISDWPAAEERPRERLLAQGAQALSDAELVAMLLRTGVRGKSAVELRSRAVLEQCDGVTRMLEAGADLELDQGSGPREDGRSSPPPSSSRAVRSRKSSAVAPR